MSCGSWRNFAHKMYSPLWGKQRGRCYYCDRAMAQPHKRHEAPDRLRTLEHLQPVARGGLKYDCFNLTLACHYCNNAKGDLTEFEFALFVATFGAYPTPAFKLSYAVVCGHDAVSKTSRSLAAP